MDLAQISQVDNALLQACLEGNEDALAPTWEIWARSIVGCVPRLLRF